MLPFIVLPFITIASAALAQEPALDTENQKDFVSSILPYGLEFLRDHINLEFSSSDRTFYEDYNGKIYQLPDNAATLGDLSEYEAKKFLDFPLARRDKFYVFYGAYRNMQQALQEITPYAVAGMDNPALQHYATLPGSKRRDDIYLWSPDAPYWYSEYSAHGVPLPFRSYFILHLTRIDDSHTKIEVIEDKPVVSMGKRLSVDANGVIQHYDIRDVAPTTRDREFLLSCIRQFIDRKVPGRHWFNCKDETAETQIQQTDNK